MPVPVSEVKQALVDLGLENPHINYVRLPGNQLRLVVTAVCHVGRGVVTTLPQPGPLQPVHVHELTDIPTIGAATAQVLRKAGIRSPADLATTPNAQLSNIGLRPNSIPRIRQWLADHGYNKE